ncbi:MAG: MFS transporter [Rhodospirillales bacterium]|nr:MFS transporter [Alphaproteobacteria bacterium]MCB9986973.1 MFS transporter [Rhodospirillales bacterium]USO08253.1 MAG: MFS transporter [Rhodospirillales bacterium]
MDKKRLAAWAAFDWANSAVTTIVFTFVFAVYFARAVYGDEVAGSAAWAFAQGCAGVAVAVLSPLVGAAVDRHGPRKPALKIFTILSILLTAALYFIEPARGYVMPALIGGGVLSVAYELVQNIYGSTLPLVAPPGKIGLVSGIGWGAGYVGSILSLGIALVFFIGFGDGTGLFGLGKDHALNVRATMLLAALWFAVFATPFFVLCPDAPRSGFDWRESVSAGVRGIAATLRDAWRVPGLIRFLVGAAIYRDGLVTLFAVGGLYAAGALGMSFSQVMMFAIAMNVASGLGAITLAFWDDRVGSRRMVMLCLIAMAGLGVGIIATHDKTVFIALACLLGLFIGPVQAASRAMLVRLSPPEHLGAFFGLYAMTGKSVAFMGPFAFAALTALFHSQRAGMASIIGFWLVGLLVVYSLRPPHERAS